MIAVSNFTPLAMDSAKIAEATPVVRKLLYMVFCTAIKERAREVRIEPSETELKMFVQVGEEWREMVPVPLHVARHVVREVRMMAGLGTLRRLLHAARGLGRRFMGDHSPNPLVGRIWLDFPDTTTELSIAIEAVPLGERINVRLPEQDLPSEAARQILNDYLSQKWPDGPPLDSGDERPH